MDRSANGTATTIGQKMLAVAAQEAKEKRLPAPLAKARARLATAHEELEATRRDSLSAGDDGGAPQDVDRVEISAWVATGAWLAAWRKVPSTSPLVAIADRLHRLLFADGVRFVRVASGKRWAETERRLGHIDEHKLAADFARLGGEEILATLRRTHSATGEAQGITTPKAARETPRTRAKLDAFTAALRYYIVQVSASVDPDEPATAELAERLQEPLASYEPPPRAKSGGSAPAA